VLEVNPRASRTVPFVSKAVGVPLAKLAAKVMTGRTLVELGFTQEVWPSCWAVKESVFPFNRFHGQDILLSPEMRSTGEVMGLDDDLGIAYAKSQMAAGGPLPVAGRVFISVSDAHKGEVAEVGKLFADLGFELVATAGTAAVLERAGDAADCQAVGPDRAIRACRQIQGLLPARADGKLGGGGYHIGWHSRNRDGYGRGKSVQSSDGYHHRGRRSLRHRNLTGLNGKSEIRRRRRAAARVAATGHRSAAASRKRQCRESGSREKDNCETTTLRASHWRDPGSLRTAYLREA
jgi:hypothetical protein